MPTQDVDYSRCEGEFTLPWKQARQLQPHPYCLWFPELNAVAYADLVLLGHKILTPRGLDLLECYL